MLTVSLHGIRVTACIGLYPEEKLIANTFETDVDVWTDAAANTEWPFIDYSIINTIVRNVFAQPGVETLEKLVQDIHAAIKKQFSSAAKVRVAIRKMHPLMPGEVAYAQVCWEN